ncbi:hypothetical protein C8R45DRAFT_939473 [Mycena sanguinolenta]|nr:hypothetical protein C8R45DRAFT_939473 [Mycena sanguinolenta]
MEVTITPTGCGGGQDSPVCSSSTCFSENSESADGWETRKTEIGGLRGLQVQRYIVTHGNQSIHAVRLNCVGVWVPVKFDEKARAVHTGCGDVALTFPSALVTDLSIKGREDRHMTGRTEANGRKMRRSQGTSFLGLRSVYSWEPKPKFDCSKLVPQFEVQSLTGGLFKPVAGGSPRRRPSTTPRCRRSARSLPRAHEAKPRDWISMMFIDQAFVAETEMMKVIGGLRAQVPARLLAWARIVHGVRQTTGASVWIHFAWLSIIFGPPPSRCLPYPTSGSAAANATADNNRPVVFDGACLWRRSDSTTGFGFHVESTAYLVTICLQLWLGLRLDLFGNILVCGIALFASRITHPTSLSRHTGDPSKIGVVLSYTLSKRRDGASQRVTAGPVGRRLQVRPGEKVDIVGTGAGNSSLQVLFWMVELQSGEIDIDGHNIKVGCARQARSCSPGQRPVPHHLARTFFSMESTIGDEGSIYSAGENSC